MSIERQSICALLGQALFGKTARLPAEVDQDLLLQEAVAQAVLPLVYSVLEPQLEKERKERWQRLNERVLTNNLRSFWEHSELHEAMQEAEIPYTVMKGCASAMYYPDPLLRMMGDVDFLVRTEDLDRGDEVLKSLGFLPPRRNESECHLGYSRPCAEAKASSWEMHWEPNGIPEGDAGDRIRGMLIDAIDKSRQIEGPTGSFRTPTDFHHGLILLVHTATHWINSGIGLRHLCDWAVFVDSFPEGAFQKLFESPLRSVGLWDFARLLSSLSSWAFGAREQSWAGHQPEALLQQLMEDIFDAGNFGKKDRERLNEAKWFTDRGKGRVDDTGALRQFFRTMSEKARAAMPLCRRFPLLLPLGWLYAGLRHLIRILQGKRPKIHVKKMISGVKQRRELYQQFHLFDEQSKK